MRWSLAFLASLCCALVGCKPAQTSVTTLKIPVSASAAATQLSVSDWAEFRGGSHHGVVPSESLPVEWDPRQGVVWIVPVAPGSSSPIICGDNVFLTSETEQGEGSECHLHCLSRLSGEEQWRVAIGIAKGSTHRKNGFAAATPACDGLHVFTSVPQLGIYCHNLQGREVWHHSLGNVSQKWGFASSPIIYEGLVIQLCDSEADSSLTAFVAGSGEIAWQMPRDSQGCWATPVVTNFGGVDLLIINGTGSNDGSQGEVIAYDPRTGSEVWRVEGTTDIPCPTAIVADDLIISSSGGNGPIFALRSEVSLPAEERFVWRQAAGGPYVPTGVALDGLLYIMTDGGVLTCYRVADGERLYRKRLHGTFSSSLLAGAGKVYIASEQGDVYVIQAGEEYALLSTNRMRGRCLATPAIAYDQLFLRTETELFCIDGVDPDTDPELRVPPNSSLPSPSDTLLEDEDVNGSLPSDAEANGAV